GVQVGGGLKDSAGLAPGQIHVVSGWGDVQQHRAGGWVDVKGDEAIIRVEGKGFPAGDDGLTDEVGVGDLIDWKRIAPNQGGGGGIANIIQSNSIRLRTGHTHEVHADRQIASDIHKYTTELVGKNNAA